MEAVGGNGTVARYGGEEFVVLLPGYSNKDSLQIAEELRQKIANIPFIIESTLQNSNHTQALL